MKITITYKEGKLPQTLIGSELKPTAGKLVEEYISNRVTFPAEYPYMILGTYPKVRGKSHQVFLPDIFELVISE
jgi:hypothetical protein